MSTTAETIRNGVDTEQLYGTLDAIKAQPDTGDVPVPRAQHLDRGAHNRTTIKGFYAAEPGGHLPRRGVVIDAGEPAILLGRTRAPTRPSTCCTRWRRA